MDLLATLRRYLSLDDDPAILARAARLEDPSRRRFLRTALIATTLAATVDVDQLLWTPRPHLLTASSEDLIAYGFVTPDWVMRETLRILKANLVFATHVHREYTDLYRRGGRT